MNSGSESATVAIMKLSTVPVAIPLACSAAAMGTTPAALAYSCLLYTSRCV